MGTGLAMMSAGMAVRQNHEPEKEICILFDVTLKTAPQQHSRDVYCTVCICVKDQYPGGQDPGGVGDRCPSDAQEGGTRIRSLSNSSGALTLVPQRVHAGFAR